MKSKVAKIYKAQKSIDAFVKKIKIKEQKHEIKNEHADYVNFRRYL